MAKLFLLCLLYAAVSAQYYKLPEKDTHSVETLPDDLKELQNRLNCFNDKEPCNEAAAVFKEYIPESMQDACAKCSPYLKNYYHVFIETAEKYFPEDMKQIQQKYDPDGTLYNKLKNSVKPF